MALFIVRQNNNGRLVFVTLLGSYMYVPIKAKGVCSGQLVVFIHTKAKLPHAISTGIY